ncbi:hypothetical protein FJV43_03580 [Bradyrhizobium sp. I71]|nr:hypothetical protein FJV43_03580 [Bradyrhizobium sp. I71]
MQLAIYLERVAGRDCAYGVHDCATLMADWLIARGYPDAMPDRRGTYATEAEYRAAIRSEGGMVAACRKRFARVGLAGVAQPAAGDVALVLAPNARGLRVPAGAIAMDRGRVALLSWPRGVVVATLPVLAAWSVGRG